MLHQKIRPNYIFKNSQKLFKNSYKFFQCQPVLDKAGLGFQRGSEVHLPTFFWTAASTPVRRPTQFGLGRMAGIPCFDLYGQFSTVIWKPPVRKPPPKTWCDHLPKNSPVGFFTGIRLQDLSYYPAVRILILSPYFRTAMNNSRPMIRYTTDMIW